ncbi:MAG: hypothetical protein KatS3mg004_0292 [Bryobacteraceae bacterium]|nr:MAG: hypothetical protein KatS3mg004_0292 [Bryobacteraceae bacterium]
MWDKELFWMPPKVRRPCVSIVLPTRNGSRYIREAIESVLGQTYTNLELIVVLDACSDGTESIVRELAVKDQRIGVLKSDVNLRLPRALNCGFEKSRGGYLTWTSDDNVFFPTAIEKLVYALDSSGADIAVGGEEIVDRNGVIKLTRTTIRWDLFPTSNQITACFLYRRHVHDRLNGYDPRLFLAEDYDFFLRAYCCGFRFVTVPELLYRYRRHEESLSIRRAAEVPRVRDRVILKSMSRFPDSTGELRGKTAVVLASRFKSRGEWLLAAYAMMMGLWHAPVMDGKGRIELLKEEVESRPR